MLSSAARTDTSNERVDSWRCGMWRYYVSSDEQYSGIYVPDLSPPIYQIYPVLQVTFPAMPELRSVFRPEGQ